MSLYATIGRIIIPRRIIIYTIININEIPDDCSVYVVNII